MHVIRFYPHMPLVFDLIGSQVYVRISNTFLPTSLYVERFFFFLETLYIKLEVIKNLTYVVNFFFHTVFVCS